MTGITCDVAIIGAGTAWLAAERSARTAGAKTLLVDGRFAGTSCATVGCMPSRLSIAAADGAQVSRSAAVFDIGKLEACFDGTAVKARVRVQRDAFVESTLRSIQIVPAGIRHTAHARFVGPTTLALDDGETVTAIAIVVVTGRPGTCRLCLEAWAFGCYLRTNCRSLRPARVGGRDRRPTGFATRAGPRSTWCTNAGIRAVGFDFKHSPASSVRLIMVGQ